MRAAFASMMAAALIGCGGGGGTTNENLDGGDGGNLGGACSVTLSGAISKTLPCTISSAYSNSDNTSGVGLTTSSFQGGAVPEATFALKVTGELQQTTYTWTNAVDQGASVYEGGANAWTASERDTKGSSQVQLTSVGTTATVSSGKIYAVHGTITATLVSATGAGGGIELNATF